MMTPDETQKPKNVMQQCMIAAQRAPGLFKWFFSEISEKTNKQMENAS